MRRSEELLIWSAAAWGRFGLSLLATQLRIKLVRARIHYALEDRPKVGQSAARPAHSKLVATFDGPAVGEGTCADLLGVAPRSIILLADVGVGCAFARPVNAKIAIQIVASFFIVNP